MEAHIMKSLFEEALSYDDILLMPGYSELLPKDCDITTRLCKTLRLNVPIISAAMDTVTEEKLAIALALEGGAGVIHRNLSPEEQTRQVSNVKRYLNWIIENHVTVRDNVLIGDLKMLLGKYNVSSAPVLNSKGKLVGIITGRDLRFCTNDSLKVSDLMTKKLIVEYGEASEASAREKFDKYRIEKLPVVDDQNMLTGLITVRDMEKRELYPRAATDKAGRLIVGAAVAPQDYRERLPMLKTARVDFIVLDTAHGDSKNVMDAIGIIKKEFNIPVIGGNVVSKEGTRRLIDAGADVYLDIDLPLKKKAITEAVRQNDINAVRALTESGADVHAICDEPLMAAVNLGNAEACRLLIKAGANVNAKHHSKKPLLSYAGSTEVVRLLIDAGADVNAQAYNGETPLTNAARLKGAEAVRYLIEAGADVNSGAGETPLMIAANFRNTEAARALIEAGANFNAQAYDRVMSFMKSTGMMEVNDEVVRIVIEAMADEAYTNRCSIRYDSLYPPEESKRIAKLIINKYPSGVRREAGERFPKGLGRDLRIYSASMRHTGASPEKMQVYEDEIRSLKTYSLDAIAEVYAKHFGYWPKI